MWMLATIPFFLQAIAILFDEGYFHWKRGLPKWERIGHPLDTLSLVVCLAMTVFVTFTPTALKLYAGLAVFSCLMVTKDEFVHKHHCPGAENWLHALLFLLHPITLTMAALIWPVTQGIEVTPWVNAWLNEPQLLKWFLDIQTLLITVFFFYQLIFWNFIWKNSPVIKH